MLLLWVFIIKINKKLAGPPVYYTRLNESNHSLQIKMAGEYLKVQNLYLIKELKLTFLYICFGGQEGVGHSFD